MASVLEVTIDSLLQDTFLWLSREDLKGDTERSGIGNKNIMQQKYYKQKQIANA